ncbi:MAG: outer membrane beta-barrel protein [Bacteroidota bacterium]
MMNKITYRKIILTLIISICSYYASAQSIFKKEETRVGIHLSPIIPNNMIQNNDVSLITDSIEYNMKQAFGLNFGMEIRTTIYERFSLHAGINYCRRNFNIKITAADSLFTDSTLKFYSYEIPVYAGGYVKLARHFFLNGNLGACLDFYPTDISIPHVYGKRYNWVQFSVVGGTGLEWRTKKNGWFYIGMSYKAHFKNMLYVLFYKNDIIGSADEYIPFSGNYFSLAFKYYLP